MLQSCPLNARVLAHTNIRHIYTETIPVTLLEETISKYTDRLEKCLSIEKLSWLRPLE